MNASRATGPYDGVILALQGGGALGAYQAGVFEGMTEAGYLPDWIAGVSMGAVDPDVRILEAAGTRRRIDIVRLINRRFSYMGSSKDYEFSRATVNELWAAGLADARRIVAHPESLVRTDLSDGVRVYDLNRGSRKGLGKLLHRWREKLRPSAPFHPFWRRATH